MSPELGAGRAVMELPGRDFALSAASSCCLEAESLLSEDGAESALEFKVPVLC